MPCCSELMRYLPTSCTSSVLLLRRALVRTVESAGAATAPAMQGALVCTKREWVMRWRYAHRTRQVRPYLQPPAAAASLRPSTTAASIYSNAFCLLQDRLRSAPMHKRKYGLATGASGALVSLCSFSLPLQLWHPPFCGIGIQSRCAPAASWRCTLSTRSSTLKVLSLPIYAQIWPVAPSLPATKERPSAEHHSSPWLIHPHVILSVKACVCAASTRETSLFTWQTGPSMHDADRMPGSQPVLT